MYEYIWDDQTGGILLTTNQSKFSKEPRPVYSRELDILGFDQHWNYPHDDSAPIMWAEANNYYYRGKLVAKTKGGSIYTKPEIVILDTPEPSGDMLQFVDIKAMCDKNRNILETLVQETIQKIYNTYMEYRNKIDVYYVAFSGGKDSIVALDLVQRALPHDSFLVLFGDTQMEFEDTYALVEKQKELCAAENINFIVSKSEQPPEITWREFGSPSQTMRWCCSVHKTAPQILALRELTNNPSFRGMAFTGIRADESSSRSQYDDVTYGGKHKGQYSCHAILNWSSAEVFLYIYDNDLLLNETYKKGNSRAGCLVCPMAAYKNFFFKEQSYGGDPKSRLSTTMYTDIILETTSKVFATEKDKIDFMETGGWKARRSGRELNISEDFCNESLEKGILTITLLRERTDWREWIKTIGDVISISDSAIEIVYEKKSYTISRRIKGKQQVFTALPRHLGFCRLLAEKGFNVKRCYADSFSEEERADFEWLKAHCHDLEILPTVNVKMEFSQCEEKYLAVGQKAAFFCQTDNFVDIVAGGGGYGFEGIKRLAELMAEGAVNKKDRRKVIQHKGWGCESCL